MCVVAGAAGSAVRFGHRHVVRCATRSLLPSSADQAHLRALLRRSLGCIAAELFLGLPIFPGVSQHNQLFRIIHMIGYHCDFWPGGPTSHVQTQCRCVRLWLQAASRADVPARQADAQVLHLFHRQCVAFSIPCAPSTHRCLCSRWRDELLAQIGGDVEPGALPSSYTTLRARNEDTHSGRFVTFCCVVFFAGEQRAGGGAQGVFQREQPARAG